MLTYDLVIRNCRIVKPSGSFRGEIGIKNGKISFIGTTVDGSITEEIDGKGKFVLPGVIDPHVHLGTADQNFAEAVRTESIAASAGGVTTALIYKQIPALHPPDELLEATLAPDIRAIEEGSLIDIGFHGLILKEEALDRIDELIEKFGMTSFKFIMAYKGEEALPHFYGMNDGSLFKMMEKIGKRKGCVSIVHAENSELNERFKRDYRHRQDSEAWSDSRPSLSEEEAIRRAVFFSEKASSPLCIAHVSTEAGAMYVAEAKKCNRYLWQETCPHYLFLTKKSKFDPPSAGKVNPPLRDASDVLALWTLLGKGVIDIIGSDHCPFTLRAKPKDLWSARPGFPGIELILPILLSEGVNKGRITIEDVSRVTSLQPSKLFGLYPQKGIIEVGSDADLVIVDLEKEVEIMPSILHGFSDYTPYQGYVVTGWPVTTIVRGRVVFEAGRLRETKGKGVFLRRKRVDFTNI